MGYSAGTGCRRRESYACEMTKAGQSHEVPETPRSLTLAPVNAAVHAQIRFHRQVRHLRTGRIAEKSICSGADEARFQSIQERIDAKRSQDHKARELSVPNSVRVGSRVQQRRSSPGSEAKSTRTGAPLGSPSPGRRSRVPNRSAPIRRVSASSSSWSFRTRM